MSSPTPRPEISLTPELVLALGALARAWRRDLASHVIAVTGSVGKTSTKDLLGQVLAAAAPTVSPPGSYNNDIGLPLTVLRPELAPPRLTPPHTKQALLAAAGVDRLL